MPPFSLRPKEGRGPPDRAVPGLASAYVHAAVDLGLNGIVPADATPGSAAGRGAGKLSLRKGPVKPPAPCQDDEDEPPGAIAVLEKVSPTSNLTMAGAVAVSLRRSLRSTGDKHEAIATSEPRETFAPCPPSGPRPNRTGSRPTPQGRFSSSSQDDARLATESPTSREPPRGPIRAFCQQAGSNMSRPAPPAQPRAPEDTAPNPIVDDDEWRLSNFSFRSSRNSNCSRAKSTPSRGRRHRPDPLRGSTNPEDSSPAGVIQGTKLLRGGRRGISALNADDESGVSMPRSAAQERESAASRRTNTFTENSYISRGTGTICSNDESGRGTFNFGEVGDQDDEGMLNETIGDY